MIKQIEQNVSYTYVKFQNSIDFRKIENILFSHNSSSMNGKEVGKKMHFSKTQNIRCCVGRRRRRRLVAMLILFRLSLSKDECVFTYVCLPANSFTN